MDSAVNSKFVIKWVTRDPLYLEHVVALLCEICMLTNRLTQLVGQVN